MTMMYYAKITNENTKKCMVGTGTDKEFYQSIGMTLQDVEQTDDGSWYLKGYAPEPEPPTEEEIQQQLTAAVQAYMDKTVQARNYDNIHTACSYANSTDHIFAYEGIACVKWRDAVWRKCYDVLAEVKQGARTIPSVDELLAELPTLEW